MEELAIVVGIIISYVLAIVTYSFGNKKKKYDECAYLSGESLRTTRIQYPAEWIFFAFLMVALDAAFVMLAISTFYVSLATIVYLGIISMLLPLLRRLS